MSEIITVTKKEVVETKKDSDQGDLLEEVTKLVALASGIEMTTKVIVRGELDVVSGTTSHNVYKIVYGYKKSNFIEIEMKVEEGKISYKMETAFMGEFYRCTVVTRDAAVLQIKKTREYVLKTVEVDQIIAKYKEKFGGCFDMKLVELFVKSDQKLLLPGQCKDLFVKTALQPLFWIHVASPQEIGIVVTEHYVEGLGPHGFIKESMKKEVLHIPMDENVLNKIIETTNVIINEYKLEFALRVEEYKKNEKFATVISKKIGELTIIVRNKILSDDDKNAQEYDQLAVLERTLARLENSGKLTEPKQFF